MDTLWTGVLDDRQALHCTLPVGLAHAMIAALAAEPQTLAEWEQALRRYREPDGDKPFFASWDRGLPQPAGGAALVVDLPGRLVAGRSVEAICRRQGEVAFCDGWGPTAVRLPYCLSDDWEFSGRFDQWQQGALRRRRERAAVRPLDTREVLYGKVAEFLAEGCLAEAGAAEKISAEIHARWLLMPRADLRQQAPRDVLLARRQWIDADIDCQRERWVRTGKAPPGLPHDSAAYRFASFGTQEIVVYYDLLRYLLGICFDHLAAGQATDLAEEVDRLERAKQDWLHTPQIELEGHSPVQVIARERSRLPLVVSDSHAVLDDDCPLCRMIAESEGPIFWFLDGSHMDGDFAFSLCATREQWQAERCDVS